MKRKMAQPRTEQTKQIKRIKRTVGTALVALMLSGLLGQTVGAQPPVVQAQLSDLGQFPLLPSAARGTLVAADNQLSPVRTEPTQPILDARPGE